MQVDAVGRRTWMTVLRAQAERHPDKVALIDDETGASLTYGELLERARSLAAGLAEQGFGLGDRLLLYLGNRPEYAVALLGVHLLGGVGVLCSTEYTDDELRYQAGAAGVVGVLTDRERLARATGVVGASVKLVREVSLLEDIGPTGALELPRLAPTDLASVLFTSGTTARPKGVLLTHGNYVYGSEVIRSCHPFEPDDVALLVFPLYLSNGHTYQLVPWLMTGMTIVLTPRFSVSRFQAQLARHRVTVTSINAAHIKMLLTLPESAGEADNCLRFVKFGTGASARTEHLEEFSRRYRTRLFGGTYSQTETIVHNVYTPTSPEDHWREQRGGLPTLGYRVRLELPDGNEAEPGQIGEILVSCNTPHGICAGYDGDAEGTRRVWDGEWWRTGDLGVVDETGYLTFVDRGKDMLKIAGFNVAPAEVERVLLDHPAVDDVAVIGVEDPVRDQAVKAFVVLTDAGGEVTVDELLDHCRRFLAPFKVPTYVEYVDLLPRSVAGKLDKKSLAARG